MAKPPGSGIKITNHNMTVCNLCKGGTQSRTDTGKNAPIDPIGGVDCSDMKDPLTPRVRLGNRYLVNVFDHKSNYCRVLLAPTKDKAAKRFKDFVLTLSACSSARYTSFQWMEAMSTIMSICSASAQELRGK